MDGKRNDPALKGPSRNPEVTVVRREDYREDYANSVQVNVTVWDFFLQFGRLGMGKPGGVTFTSFAGVYLSPQQAKALQVVLAQNIAQYESTFGTIRIENPGSEGPIGLVQ